MGGRGLTVYIVVLWAPYCGDTIFEVFSNEQSALKYIEKQKLEYGYDDDTFKIREREVNDE